MILNPVKPVKPGAPPPIVWSIAGSDSSGGAGIQADVKAAAFLGAHLCTAITAVTAQSSRAFRHASFAGEESLREQILALREDFPPRALKLGILGGIEAIQCLAEHLPGLGAPVVCDPVLASSSGRLLLEEDAMQSLRERIFPLASVVTPNVPEAERLAGFVIDSPARVEEAAAALLRSGAKSVVIKGGHSKGEFCQDYWTDGKRRAWLTSERRRGVEARGTGCTFATALAVALAFGFDPLDAAVVAKAYVNQGLRTSSRIAPGPAILGGGGWPAMPEDLPWLTFEPESGTRWPEFPSCGPERLGFYPIVDRLEWLERILRLGVRTAQLRIKDLRGQALEDEIRRSILLARDHGCRLFINDYWELALKHGAYGVHLGQEDLEAADLWEISGGGLRLGLSTHCYSEVARAHSFRPSYLAIGPIFPTTLKAMAFEPQGVESLRQWRGMLKYPLVAIGGISLENAEALLQAGADSIAVVSDVTKNADPEERVRSWLKLFTIGK